MEQPRYEDLGLPAPPYSRTSLSYCSASGVTVLSLILPTPEPRFGRLFRLDPGASTFREILAPDPNWSIEQVLVIQTAPTACFLCFAYEPAQEGHWERECIAVAKCDLVQGACAVVQVKDNGRNWRLTRLVGASADGTQLYVVGITGIDDCGVVQYAVMGMDWATHTIRAVEPIPGVLA